jgi:hypothetical protein
VNINDGFSEELKEVILNGGMEYWYGSFIAIRGGYIYDQEGEIKTPTFGFGLLCHPGYRCFERRVTWSLHPRSVFSSSPPLLQKPLQIDRGELKALQHSLHAWHNP